MRVRSATVILVTSLALASAACGSQATIDGRPGGAGRTDPSEDAPNGAGSDDELLALAIADIETFWADEYPRVYGEDYEPLEGGLRPYSSRRDPPDCGEPLDYEDVMGNAFYCPLTDVIAWDEQRLLPALEAEFGNFAIALVMAHEWGHAIQKRAGVDGPTILLEQQADCFAGAWTARLAAGDSDSLELGDDTLDVALAGMLAFSDQPGTPASDPKAHGLGFDRASAFQDGFERGADGCSTFVDDPPLLLSALFEEQGSFVPNNLPYDEASPLLVTDLDEYWSLVLEGEFASVEAIVPYDVDGPARELPQCGPSVSDPELLADAVLYCAETNTVAWDDDFLRSVHRRIGDFGSATLLANQWARAAQAAMEIDSAVPGAELHGDCLTGSWIAYLLLGGSRNISLTPDDLDEVIQAFLQVNLGVADNEVTGERLAFDRLAALRSGMVDGVDVCRDYEP